MVNLRIVAPNSSVQLRARPPFLFLFSKDFSILGIFYNHGKDKLFNANRSHRTISRSDLRSYIVQSSMEFTSKLLSAIRLHFPNKRNYSFSHSNYGRFDSLFNWIDNLEAYLSNSYFNSESDSFHILYHCLDRNDLFHEDFPNIQHFLVCSRYSFYRRSDSYPQIFEITDRVLQCCSGLRSCGESDFRCDCVFADFESDFVHSNESNCSALFGDLSLITHDLFVCAFRCVSSIVFC